MKKVVVLGAGPAGLTAAYKLIETGYEVEVLEARDHVGGMSGSLKWNNCILDYGPHAFHLKKGEIVPLVKSLLKDEEILVGKRYVLLLLKDKYFEYPMRFYEVIRKLNPFFSLKMIFDFLMTSLIYRYIAVPDNTFESWGIKRFGNSLYKLCFGTYTEKVWGIPPATISPKFASKKLHKLNLKDIIHKLLGGQGEEQETYWENYLYPKYGIGYLYEKMAQSIEQQGGKVRLNSRFAQLQKKNGGFQITFEQEGEESVVESDLVISSIPISEMALSLIPGLGDYASYKAKLLKFRDLILVNLVVKKEHITEAMWIYLVDEKFKFNRFTEQKNLSPFTCPQDKTLLCFEISCNLGDSLWRASDEELYQMVLNDIGSIDLIDSTLIEDYNVIRVKDAYPIYDLDFDKNLRVVLDKLSDFEGLYSTGRQGLFLQNDIHDSMEMGRLVVDCLNDKGMKSREWYEYMLSYWEI